MSDLLSKFSNESAIKAFDTKHRAILDHNIGHYQKQVIQGKLQYFDLELAKRRAAYLKFKVINDLPNYLHDFESAFQARGGKIIWAQDAHEAISEILKIAKNNQAKQIVKSKTMVSEEISLNESLQKAHIESLETDLGEYIVQLAGEKPYHILSPAIHKSKEEVGELFNQQFGLDKNSSPAVIASYVRELLREKFNHADIGITGATFLIADVGAISITENEGNALKCISFPNIHIAVVGIEKIIPKLRDLDLFLPLLATFGTGQNITAYNSIVFGPRQENEPDGPEEMYILMLDNHRSELLAQKKQRRALSCIRCGACLNVCPVYKTIGGHTYNTTYSGPIGAVITPSMKGLKSWNHLSFASSLCGACSEVCPVKINLHELLLQNRNDSVKAHLANRPDKKMMYFLKKAMLNRKFFDMFGHKFKMLIFKHFFAKSWGENRVLPQISPQSFKQIWHETHELSSQK